MLIRFLWFDTSDMPLASETCFAGTDNRVSGVEPLGADEVPFFAEIFCAACVVAAFLGGILHETQFSDHFTRNSNY